MRRNFKKHYTTTIIGILVLLLGATLAVAQQQVNLTAGPATATLPDGSQVPMWGYSCGAAVGGSTASCAALKPNTMAGQWSPVVITVPGSGGGLTINLTNNLTFATTGLATNVPTSIVIVGQLGGGLGTARTTTPSPLHDNQPTTWPIANAGAVFTPPSQNPRVQSMASEVSAVASTTTATCTVPNSSAAVTGCATLTWSNLRPGTYLIESGTHPSIQGPMGLYGVLVVTTAPSGTTPGTAYGVAGSPTAVSYNAEIPLLFSEIDPVQNKAVQAAVSTAGFSESATYGTYLNGPVVSVNVTNGGSGYTSATATFVPSGATASVTVDPTSGQVVSVDAPAAGYGGSYSSAPQVVINGDGSGATAVAALQLTANGLAHCSGGVAACYPPAVNYTPLYYLINGSGFDKTNGPASLYAASPASGVSGTVLVRLVNAGLRMHVPSIVGSLTGSPTAVSGFSLIAEDGNQLPGVPRVQSEVFMAAGKTYDVMVNVPTSTAAPALPIFDRELSLSGNSIERDAGMLAYIGINGAGLPSTPAFAPATANPDFYNSVIAGKALTISDPAKGVLANDVNVYGVALAGTPVGGTVTLSANGTFTFTPATATTTSGSFVYCGNGATSGPTCTTVTLGAAPAEAASGIIVNPDKYSSNTLSLKIAPPGVLANDQDLAGYPLTVQTTSITKTGGNAAQLTIVADQNGGFNASATAAGTYTFTYRATSSRGTVSGTATVTLVFPAPSNLVVTVLDGADKKTTITDYRWIIEEDRTFYVDPRTTANNGGSVVVPTFGTNFHTSYMPVVATGCTGQLSCEGGQTLLGQPAVCDQGNGVCRTTGTQEAVTMPGSVHLDPTKRYYISILPGDAANPFIGGNGSAPANCSAGPGSLAAGLNTDCGHGMGGAPIAAGQTSVTILTQPTPFPPAQLSVFVFEDDFPLNGEYDAGGGVDVLAANEPGLGSFQITLFDDAGGSGDATGQPTYDMFNMPLSNALAGTIDPTTQMDACPISAVNTLNASVSINKERTGFDGTASPTGIAGMIVTCPTYESDGVTLSPLAGQAVVANLYPGRYGVVATPAADRIARNEEWLQTNTLDGQKAHDSFLRIGEPSFFQEFGPAGYHVSIGFANPAIINSRHDPLCSPTGVPTSDLLLTDCTNTVTGNVTTERMSRTPDERLYSSGDISSFAFTQCYVSLGDPDGIDFMFTKCAADGSFSFAKVPKGSWRVTVFDQWNDMLVDGLSTPVAVAGNGSTTSLGQIAMNQWQANIYTRTFFDTNGDGVSNVDTQGNPTEPGLALVATNIRFRDGSYSNFNNTDLNGFAGFNEVFPLFSWYVIETDTTRFKSSGTHVVYDAGGPADGTSVCGASGNAPCGSAAGFANMANTAEQIPVPANLRIPGARYCANADCPSGDTAGGSTGRVDPPIVHPFGSTYGWQGFSGQNSFLEFAKKPFATGENGGIHGHVIYASTRPFDDPQLLLQLSWEPLVPNVTINLYKEGTAPDGSQSLVLVDTTKTSSWDDWAQGFRSDGTPNMNCPGQGRDTGTDADLFFFTLLNQPMWLDAYNYQHGGPAPRSLPNNAQYKCYDGMHNWNQLQPAPYDGMYQFPSVTSIDATGKPNGTNCTGCILNPDSTDPYRAGTPMLPAGRYVVEVVVPPGYELVKEEDKNILIGDNYIAPPTQQFAGLGNIFILPDEAEVTAAYNGNNPQNPTNTLGRVSTLPSHEGDTGSVESFWPCVGASRIVPDYISLFPGSQEVSPFAGATRNLCDRKEVTLDDQTAALAKFYIFTSTHVAAHFTGVITDDFTSEFDPFSPQFGEKFSPANLPISVKDWAGNEVSRVYTDQWGTFNGLQYSTWEVNPPNPTGYAPTMMVTCMNDPGTGPTPDPLYNPSYSQFCYEIPFMPGQTQYMDTPVVPTSAFAGAGYNNADCNYPDFTPAIKSVISQDIAGPWVSAAGHTLTIAALGDQMVNNYGYSGPSVITYPFNQKRVSRHYGFGSTAGTVTIGGVPASVSAWTDSSITVAVPSGVPPCAVSQQSIYGGSTAQCGQLVITAANGKQSIDTVTVTIGGKTPTVLSAGQTVQSAIDAALPGDMIIVPPGTYNEMLLMWKPVRLQGVGATSSILNANTHPAGKMDPWRRQVVCLFGLALNGQPQTPGVTTGTGANPYDPSGTYSCGSTNGVPWGGFDADTTGKALHPQVDRIPLEGVLGWDTTVNGNLAEMLQEPTLMGAYEGAGITVLAKGVSLDASGVPPFSQGAFGTGAESTFPAGTRLLTSGDCLVSGANPYPSNFYCNPASIDGLTVSNSSQGGGGIFVHAWGHNLQIANNRVTNNTGTLTGGITVGQGESPDAYLAPDTSSPTSCMDQTGVSPNVELPFCFDVNVNVHNNAVTLNSSIGDELFSSTPAGAGGATVCVGADYYKFQYNWICGNLSTGDGGGLVQLGFVWGGDVEHNTFLFNQSANPTVPTNGGGMIVMGAPPDGAPAGSAAGTECGGTAADADCTPGLSDGSGPGLVINANLFLGNAAESGSGGAIRFQSVNGTEVDRFPDSMGVAAPCAPLLASFGTCWNSVTVTNNIIANNIAGWDGAGISLQDALDVNIINNTIMSNDTTASSGVLFNTLGAPLASSQGSNCMTSATTSCPQPAGLVAIQNSVQLTSSLAGPPALTLTCPTGHPNCATVSFPLLANDVFWQNRAFYIGVGTLGSGGLNQQNVVALYNAFSATQAASQSNVDATAANGNGTVITGGTGACVSGSAYWDLGVRGDTGPTDHSSTITLAPSYSVLTAGYTGSNNSNSNPAVISQYCNGSRVPPELGSMGYQVPPGISDATVPNPIFNLTPAATVDEGNNWINISWGPLSMQNPITHVALGNYGPAAGSPVINAGTSAAVSGVTPPTTDFYGNTRVAPNDIGAVEFVGTTTGGNPTGTPTLASISPAYGVRNSTVPATLYGTGFTGTTGVTVSGTGVTVSGVAVVNDTTLTANFAITAAAAIGARNVTVVTSHGTTNPSMFTVETPTLSFIVPTQGAQGTSVNVTLYGSGLTGVTSAAFGAGITLNSISALNDTTVQATITISPTAALTARNVTVTSVAGTSAVNPAVTFRVVPPATPTLNAISPARGVRSTAVAVKLTGSLLNGATAVTVSGAGITVGPITSSANEVDTTFTISATAAVGARNVSVTTPGGVSNFVTFEVLAPTLSSVSPNVSVRGVTNLPVTFTGIGLTGASAFTATPAAGFTLSGLTVVNDTTVTANLTITTAAATGVHTISITTPDGSTNTVPFTVLAPSLTSMNPSSGLRGTTFSVTITGTNLTGATGVTISGSGVTASAVSAVNDTTVTATFTITTTAATGARTVTVTGTPAGSTNTVPFTVVAAAITAVNPNVALNGATPVTFTGTNLAGVTAGTVSGSGVTVTGITAGATSVTATVNVTAGAARTLRTISLTGTNGPTNTLAFTVGPFVGAITPNSATRGTSTISVPVSLGGAGLTGATGLTLSGPPAGGVTVTGFGVSADGTTVTATLNIIPTATAGILNIAVVTPSGNSNTVPFTVN